MLMGAAAYAGGLYLGPLVPLRLRDPINPTTAEGEPNYVLAPPNNELVTGMLWGLVSLLTVAADLAERGVL